ncbi:hypothetical protein AB0H88_27765 [Nonomuraea sp. NPDC050680]|uniref:hypothetical protein n=1 Tax=Nonomuraea sp. NPDC050680 TaxID=3154630 RepID=UPI00340D99C0
MHSEEQAEQAMNELSDRVYTALRDGGLDAESVLELACLFEVWDVSTPATRELLDRSAADLTPPDLARLGKGLLVETRFEPSFALEPRLLSALEQALEVVERDVRARGITGAFRLITSDGGSLAWVEFQGGYRGSAGIRPPIFDGDIHVPLGEVADIVQETIMDLTGKVWPVCATHNRGLHVGWDQERTVWRCTGDGAHTVAPVGELP